MMEVATEAGAPVTVVSAPSAPDVTVEKTPAAPEVAVERAPPTADVACDVLVSIKVTIERVVLEAETQHLQAR